MKRRTDKKRILRPTVVIGSDHAGYNTKQVIIKNLTGKGYVVLDVGNFKRNEHVDYPLFAALVAKQVARDKTDSSRGVLVCGTGTGMAIAANKIRGIRAAFAYDAYSARMAREHNNANIITLRGRKFSVTKAVRLADIFLTTQFSNEQSHMKRIKEISDLERI